MFNDNNILATQYAITKRNVKSNPKQPSCKKSLLPQNTIVKKDMKSKVAVMVG